VILIFSADIGFAVRLPGEEYETRSSVLTYPVCTTIPGEYVVLLVEVEDIVPPTTTLPVTTRSDPNIPFPEKYTPFWDASICRLPTIRPS
jgi:hypothetical protein